jgi:hypothetical protein
LSNVPCVEAYPYTVALYDDQTFRDFTSFSFIQANWSRRLIPRRSQGERGHLWSKCVFELSKFFYDTMQLSTVTGNLESRDAIISKVLGCFNPGRGFMGRRLISFNLYKKHIPWDRGKWLKGRGRSVWDCLPAKYTSSDLECGQEKDGKMQQLKQMVKTSMDHSSAFLPVCLLCLKKVLYSLKRHWRINIPNELVPNQYYQEDGDMARYVKVFNPFKTNMIWERGKWQRMSTRSSTLVAMNHYWHVHRTIVCLVIYDMIRLLFFHMEGSDNILGTLINVPSVEEYPHIMALYDNTHPRTEPTTGRYDNVFLCADLSICRCQGDASTLFP